MKKIVLLLLITIGIALKATSQENLVKGDSTCYSYQDTKIIAKTFNENNYLKQRVDSLESLKTIYKEDIDNYKFKDSIQEYRYNLMDGVVVTQSTAINKLSFAYNEQLKENKKTKIFNGILVGGITISLATTLYSIFK